MSKKQKVSWSKGFSEFLGIVFAVLLALSLEEWRDDHERQKHGRDMLGRVQNEIIENRMVIAEAIEKSQKNIDGLKGFLKENSTEFDQVFVTIAAGSTSNAAWTSAQMTRAIGEMPLDTVAKLADVYETQSYYSDYVRYFFREFSNLTTDMQNVDTRKPAIQKFVQHLMIINSLAEQLLAKYDAFTVATSSAGAVDS